MDKKRKFAAAGVAAAIAGCATLLAVSNSDANAAAHPKAHAHAHHTAAATYPIRHDCSAGSFPVTVIDRVASGSVNFHLYVAGDSTVPTHDYDPSLGRVFTACLLTGHGTWAIDAQNWPDHSFKTTIGVDPGNPQVVILSGNWSYRKIKV